MIAFFFKMNAAEIKVKCKDFLSALLQCANQQSKSVRDYVRTLIQKLVDAKMEPEEFSKKLNSSRPELVPFLKVGSIFLQIKKLLFNLLFCNSKVCRC